MGLFDKFLGFVTRSGQDTVKKAKDLAETSRLNGQIAGEQRALTVFYAQIGEKYYTLYKDAPAEEFAQSCERIKAGIGRIAELRDRAQQIMNVRACPKCGAECARTALFCAACGEKLPELPPDEPSAPADAETAPEDARSGD